MPVTLNSTLSHFALHVNGKELSQEEKDDVMDITVEDSLHLPDMVSIRLHDQHFKWIDSDTFKPGTRIAVFAGRETDTELLRIFSGEVTSLEMDLSTQTTPCLLVRGYDLSNRLQKGRVSRSFTKMKDSEIAQKLGSECGIKVQADPSPQQHDYVFQNNQTNWEFLQERARRIGFECFVGDDDTLQFRKPKNSQAEVIPLEWGFNLRAYRPKVTMSRQVTQVTVLGWDPKQKKQIKGEAKDPKGIPATQATMNGTQSAGELPHKPKMIIVDRPVHTIQEAKDMAQSILDELAQDYVTADGLAFGEPKLKAGVQVEIKKLGNKFSGKYYVTSTTHTWTPHEGYMTSFVIGGKHPQTITELLSSSSGNGRSGPSVLNPAGGNIVVGIVTNNVDPDGLGRIKVKYPWLVDGHESHWARLSTPMAGPKRGFYWIPEIDDEVLVAFEHGDIHRPYILGCLWNGKDVPVKTNQECVKDGLVNLRIIRTRYGHDIILDDTKGKEQLRIQTPYDNRFRMIDGKDTKQKGIFLQTGGGHKIQMVDEDSDNFIALETKSKFKVFLHDKKKHILLSTPGGHQVQLDDEGKKIVLVDQKGVNAVTIDSNNNSITMEAQGNIILKAMQNIQLQANQNIEVKAMQNFEAKAMTQAKVQANAGVDIQSSAMVNVKGAMVNLN